MTRKSKPLLRRENLILAFFIITAFFIHSPYYPVLMLGLLAFWIVCKVLAISIKNILNFRLRLPKLPLFKGNRIKHTQQAIERSPGVAERYAKALIAQLSYRIRDEVRKKYPEARIGIISNRADLNLLRCEPIKVQLENAGEFTYGEVTMHLSGKIIEFKLMVTKELSDITATAKAEVPGIPEDEDDPAPDTDVDITDIREWYQGEAGTTLYENLASYLEKDYTECFIGADGMVLTKEDGRLKPTKKIVPCFPTEEYWPEIIEQLAADGFTGEKSGKKLRIVLSQ